MGADRGSVGPEAAAFEAGFAHGEAHEDARVGPCVAFAYHLLVGVNIVGPDVCERPSVKVVAKPLDSELRRGLLCPCRAQDGLECRSGGLSVRLGVVFRRIDIEETNSLDFAVWMGDLDAVAVDNAVEGERDCPGEDRRTGSAAGAVRFACQLAPEEVDGQARQYQVGDDREGEEKEGPEYCYC